MNDKITSIKINETKWLFIEVLDDEHILIEVHEKDDTETLRDSFTITVKDYNK